VSSAAAQLVLEIWEYGILTLWSGGSQRLPLRPGGVIRLFRVGALLLLAAERFGKVQSIIGYVGGIGGCQQPRR